MLKSIKLVFIQLMVVGLLFSTVTAQEETESVSVYYIADFSIEWESLMEWNRLYYEHSVPVLQSIEDEGIITGWSAWMHNTGGEYNWRMVIGSTDWDNFDEFWDRYLSGMTEAAGDDGTAMITAHRDQIWDIAEVRYADNGDSTRYAYEALYQVDFADMEEWNRLMQENDIPLWDKAMEDGLITGYVVLGHNTGDRYNHGRVYLFDDWDAMDDFSGYVLENILSDAELWNQIGSRIRAHTDIIWERVPDEPESSN